MQPPVRDRLIRWIIGIGGLVAFALVLRTVDLTETFNTIAGRGPILVFALVPYFVQIALDSLAWKTLLGALGRRVAWARLIAIRLSTEAVLMSMPAGGIVGETLKPYLLARTDRVPAAETVATIGVKKCLLVFAEAAYLSVALIVGGDLLVRHSDDVIGRGGLPWLMIGAIVFLLLLGTVLSLLFVAGAVGGRTHRVLMAISGKRIRHWLEARHAKFAYADSCFAQLGKPHNATRLFGAGGSLLVAWFVEATETWLLLHLLGLDLSFVEAFTMEAAVVFLRNLAFFVPAGLGVQDAGYLAFLHAFGVTDVGGAAFVILKRAKELVWIALGYLVLLMLEGKRFAPSGAATVPNIGTEMG